MEPPKFRRCAISLTFEKLMVPSQFAAGAAPQPVGNKKAADTPAALPGKIRHQTETAPLPRVRLDIGHKPANFQLKMLFRLTEQL